MAASARTGRTRLLLVGALLAASVATAAASRADTRRLLEEDSKASSPPVELTLEADDDHDEEGRHAKLRKRSEDEGFWGRFDDRQRSLPTPPGTSWNQYRAILQAKDADITSSAPVPSGWSWNVYHNSAQVKTLLEFLANRYSGIASAFSIGNSKRGRPLTAIKIGSNAELAAGIPEVKLVGNMHGDETAGCEMLLRLAWDLCRRYNSNQDTLDIKSLLDTTTIYILPTMNPDGYDAVPRQRSNDAGFGVDLNRAFPKLADTAPSGLQLGPWEPEVQAIMDWSKKHNFPLSANLHGGALVANYPFDACDRQGNEFNCPTPEDPTPYNLARTIADPHLRMRQVPDFADGVTRGSEWYPVLGGMQDWIWYATQGTDITIEVHEDKEPTNSLSARLPWLYLEMRDPLLRFVESVHHSFKGTVVDDRNGERLRATVRMVPISGSGDSRRTVTGTRDARSVGQFARVITPGVRYCVEVQEAFRRWQNQVAVVELPQGAAKTAASTISHTFRLDRNKAYHFLGAAASLSAQQKQQAKQACINKLYG